MSNSITLRRAAKIRNRLTERLSVIANELRHTAVNVNIYDVDIPGDLSGKAEDYNENLARFLAVSRVLFSVRSKIDNVNAARGVNALLAEQVALLGQLRTMKTIADIPEARVDDATIAARVNGQLERAKVAQYAQETIVLTFVTDAMVESAKEQVQEIQARLDVIQESLESINSTQKIDISDADAAVLVQERLV
jgi:hypothetical protein